MDMMWYRRRGLMVTPHIESVTGAIASFNSDYNKIPIKSLICDIEPIQDLHGYDSPWPAGGGENKLWLADDIDKTVAGVRFTCDATTGLFTVNGTNTNTSPHMVQLWPATGPSIFQNFQIGETYTFFVDNTTLPMYMQFTFSNNSGGISALGYCRFSYGRISFTVPDTFVELQDFQMYIDGSATNMSGSFHIWLVEGNVSTSTFSPYSNICPISGRTGLTVSHSGTNTSDPDTISVNWQTEAGTVYGGYVDVVSGKLVEGWAIANVTTGADNGIAGGNQQIAFIATGKKGGLTNFLSNLFKNGPGAYGMTGRASTEVVEFRVPLGALNVTASDSAETRLAAFREWLLNNPTQLCYELATPNTYQLAPQEIKTLLENNIWCDTGNVSVDYWKWGN